MSHPDEPESPPPSETTDEVDGTNAEKGDPAQEIKAAFGHLKSAAGLLFGRIRDDETLKKAMSDAEVAAASAASGVERAAATAATEAEKAVRSLGAKAQPIAKDLGSELERLAKSVRSVLEPEPIPRESDPDASVSPPAQPDHAASDEDE